MERDERLRADDLDRYWDAVLRGSPPSLPPESVPGLADLVNRLHAAHGSAPTLFPDPEHAWRDLRRTPRPDVRPWPYPNGREAEPLERRSSQRSPLLSPRWMAAQLATAAVLLLSLIGFVFIRQQSLQTRDEAWTPALVQALSSVSGEVVDQVLVNAKFTAEELPAGNTEAIYYRMTLQPGVSFSSLNASAWCGCRSDLVSKGVGVEVVQSGAYSLRLDAPIRVQRNGEREVSTVPALTEVTLGPGDAVIFPDYAATGEVRNAGDDPVDLIGLAITGTEPSGTPAPALPKDVRMELLTYALPHDWEKLPRGPIDVSVRRLTLPPGESVGPYEPVGLEAMLVEQGTTYRYFYAPGSEAPGASPLYRGKGQVHPFVSFNNGARNKIDMGDEPVQLLVVLIEPTGITFETLAP